jgi:hypothetical protein
MKSSSLRLYDMAKALIALREHPEDPAIDPTTALIEARHEGGRCPMSWSWAACGKSWWWALWRPW